MRGYVLDMESVLEHRIQLAGHRDARARGRRRRPRHRAAARLERLRGHLAPAAGPARRARPARDRRRPAGLRRGHAACTTARCCPSWTRSPPSSSSAGRAASRSWSRAPRSAAASRCGWPRHPGELRLAGVVPSRPTGSRCRPGSTRSRRTRSSAGCSRSRSRSPACSCAARSRAPTASSRSRTRARRSARSSTRSAATARRARTSRRCWSPAASSRPSSSTAPFDLDRHPLPRAARLGRARPDAAAQRRADGARLAADDPGRADRGRRPPPAARGDRPPARAAASFRHLTHKFACGVARPGYTLSTMRRTVLATLALAARPRSRRRRRGAADRRRRQRRGHRRLGPDAPRGRGQALRGPRFTVGSPLSTHVAGRKFAVSPSDLDFVSTSTSPPGAPTTPASRRTPARSTCRSTRPSTRRRSTPTRRRSRADGQADPARRAGGHQAEQDRQGRLQDGRMIDAAALATSVGADAGRSGGRPHPRPRS